MNISTKTKPGHHIMRAVGVYRWKPEAPFSLLWPANRGDELVSLVGRLRCINGSRINIALLVGCMFFRIEGFPDCLAHEGHHHQD
jgi:hypothetical protein